MSSVHGQSSTVGLVEEALRKMTEAAAGKKEGKTAASGEILNDEKLSASSSSDGANSETRVRLADPTTDFSSEQILDNSSVADDERAPTSNLATMMHLLKGNIGTGILAMPFAVSNAGLALGTLLIPILGAVATHCMHLLVKCSKIVAERLEVTSLDYATTVEQAFAMGPQGVRRYSTPARISVNAMLVLTQCGFCTVYFLFVAQSINEIVKSQIGYEYMNFHWYMLMLLPVMILFNFIKTLDKLTRVSAAANVLQITALCLVFFCLVKDLGNVSSVPAVVDDFGKLPLFFGTAMYAFEGIGVVLPVENDMGTPEDFRGFTGVLNTAMIIVICLFTGVGFYGYLDYGADVKGSITFNISAPYVSEVIRALFAIAIFLTYPLQMYVALQITWSYLKSRFFLQSLSRKKRLLMNLAYRTSLVLITFLFAAFIPYLQLMIALIGAFASSSLALIFPPVTEIICVWNSNISKRKFRLIVLKDSLIALLGLVGCVLGTYVTIKEISQCFQDPQSCES